VREGEGGVRQASSVRTVRLLWARKPVMWPTPSARSAGKKQAYTQQERGAHGA